jgi:hypothetical protein
VGEEPEEEREPDAQDEAGEDREVERGVFAAMDDVTGEAAEVQREFSAEVQKSADEGKECTHKEECAAEFAEGIHQTKSKSGMRAESKSGER